MKRVYEFVLLLSGLLAAAALPVSAARATGWDITSLTFEDGGTATANFDVDVYGYLSGGALAATATTTAGTILPGDTYDYTIVAASISNSGKTVTFYSSTLGYEGFLSLTFIDPVTTGTPGVDPVRVGAGPGASYECDVWGCATGSIRYFQAAPVDGGYPTAVPEPATWVMMGLGFAGLGFAGYRGRKAIAITA